MKRVKYEYGCRALGYTDFEIYVPDEMTEDEIKEKIKNEIGWYLSIDIEEGYEEVTEIVYKKRR